MEEPRYLGRGSFSTLGAREGRNPARVRGILLYARFEWTHTADELQYPSYMSTT